jgi:hypothetical protein
VNFDNARHRHSVCAITRSFGVHCWGDTSVSLATPSLDLYVQVCSASGFACALSRTGSITCWPDAVITPTPFPGQDFTQIVCTDKIVCAIDSM